MAVFTLKIVINYAMFFKTIFCRQIELNTWVVLVSLDLIDYMKKEDNLEMI